MPKFGVVKETRVYTLVEAENAEQAQDIAEKSRDWGLQTESLKVFEPNQGFVKDFQNRSKR